MKYQALFAILFIGFCLAVHDEVENPPKGFDDEPPPTKKMIYVDKNLDVEKVKIFGTTDDLVSKSKKSSKEKENPPQGYDAEAPPVTKMVFVDKNLDVDKTKIIDTTDDIVTPDKSANAKAKAVAELKEKSSKSSKEKENPPKGYDDEPPPTEKMIYVDKNLDVEKVKIFGTTDDLVTKKDAKEKEFGEKIVKNKELSGEEWKDEVEFQRAKDIQKAAATPNADKFGETVSKDKAPSSEKWKSQEEYDAAKAAQKAAAKPNADKFGETVSKDKAPSSEKWKSQEEYDAAKAAQKAAAKPNADKFGETVSKDKAPSSEKWNSFAEYDAAKAAQKAAAKPYFATSQNDEGFIYDEDNNNDDGIQYNLVETPDEDYDDEDPDNYYDTEVQGRIDALKAQKIRIIAFTCVSLGVLVAIGLLVFVIYRHRKQRLAITQLQEKMYGECMVDEDAKYVPPNVSA